LGKGTVLIFVPAANFNLLWRLPGREPAGHSQLKEETAMVLKRAGSQPSQQGPANFFTGNVHIDPLNTAPPPARVSCARVTFEPGARTA
jgi:hypothetical protein